MIKVKDLLNVKYENEFNTKITFILRKDNAGHDWIGIYKSFLEIPKEYHENEVVQIYPGDRVYINIVIKVN